MARVIPKIPLNVRIPVWLHRALKAHAATRGETIEQAVAEALERSLPRKIVRLSKEAP